MELDEREIKVIRHLLLGRKYHNIKVEQLERMMGIDTKVLYNSVRKFESSTGYTLTFYTVDEEVVMSMAKIPPFKPVEVKRTSTPTPLCGVCGRGGHNPYCEGCGKEWWWWETREGWKLFPDYVPPHYHTINKAHRLPNNKEDRGRPTKRAAPKGYSYHKPMLR